MLEKAEVETAEMPFQLTYSDKDSKFTAKLITKPSVLVIWWKQAGCLDTDLLSRNNYYFSLWRRQWKFNNIPLKLMLTGSKLNVIVQFKICNRLRNRLAYTSFWSHLACFCWMLRLSFSQGLMSIPMFKKRMQLM